MVGTSWATIMNKKSLLWGCWGVNFQVAKSISFGILQCYPHFNSIHVLCKKMQRFLYAEDSHQFHVDCWRSPWRPGFALLRQASWRRAASEDWAARPEHGHSLSPRIGREEILGNPHFEVGTITGLVVWNMFFQYFSIQLGISWSQHIPTDFHSIICFLHSIYLYIFIIIYYIYMHWIFHHPNWRSPSFFRGVGLNHQTITGPRPRWERWAGGPRSCCGGPTGTTSI